MQDFNDHTIDKLIKLCRIECTEEEKSNLKSHLSKILRYSSELDQLDTTDVEPCYHVLGTLKNVMREDIVGETLSRELFLGNAPSHVGGLVRIPPVMKTEEES